MLERVQCPSVFPSGFLIFNFNSVFKTIQKTVLVLRYQLTRKQTLSSRTGLSSFTKISDSELCMQHSCCRRHHPVNVVVGCSFLYSLEFYFHGSHASTIPIRTEPNPADIISLHISLNNSRATQHHQHCSSSLIYA